MNNNNFNFFVPIEIEKAKGKDGGEVMKFKGIASTIDEDSDGENLDPNGFELDYFLKHGFTNWNHASKTNPAAIIGEPTVAKITPKGLYIETELYKDSALAKEVWGLAKALNSSDGKRKLGFSIEGKKLEVDPLNPKKILKAKITGVAITPTPKNSNTFADICKGHYADEEELSVINKEEVVEKSNGGETCVIDITNENGDRITVDKAMNIKIVKAMTTTNDSAVIKEDVGRNTRDQKKFSKGEVYEKIFYYIYDLEKADKVYNLIEQIEIKNNPDMKKGEITQESIDKAYEVLGLTKSEVAVLEKSETDTTIEKAETTPVVTPEVKEEVVIEKTEPVIEKSEIDLEIEKAEAKIAELKAKKANPVAIEKSISTDINYDKIADIFKSEFQKGEEKFGALGTLISKAIATGESLAERVDALEKQPTGRKSIITKSYLEKGGESEKLENGVTVLSVSRNKREVLDLLESKVNFDLSPEEFKKGNNQYFASAMADFEAANIITPETAKKLMLTDKIKLVA